MNQPLALQLGGVLFQQQMITIWGLRSNQSVDQSIKHSIIQRRISQSGFLHPGLTLTGEYRMPTSTP